MSLCFSWNWISNNYSKYIFLVIWSCINSAVFYMTYIHYKHSPEYYYLHEMLGMGLCLARATSSVINLNLGMLLLPMCRSFTTFLRYIFGHKLPHRSIRTLIDRCKGFHIISAWTLIIASGGHIIGHLMNAKHYSDYYDTRFPTLNAASKQGEDPLLIIIKSVPGITGLLLLAVLSMILSSALFSVRTSSYDLFWYTHRLFIVFYLLVLFHAIKGVLKKQTNVTMHVPGCIYLQQNYTHSAPIPHPESEPLPEDDVACDKPPEFNTIGSWTWLWLIIPLSVYICDTLYRILCKQTHPVQVVRFQQCDQEVFEIQLKTDGFSCRPGQYILLQCPQISSFEWHPFSITANYKDVFALHIKNSGDWSRNLQDLLHSCETEVSPLYIDGPFASPMEDILKYKISICIAGGIGITPFISILNYLRESSNYDTLKRLYLIWIGRNIASFLCFGSILRNLHDQFWYNNKPDILDIRLFLTKSHEGCEQEQYMTLSEENDFILRRIQYGRPQLKSLLHSIIKNHEGNLGVFCCGTKSLTKAVENQCNEMKSTTSTLHFYHESF